MAENIVVKITEREARGKNDSRRLRREGKIPVTIYGGGEAAVSGIAELKDLAAIIRSDSGVNTLFMLEMDGHDESRVIFQERQIHPVTGRLMHADLRRLAKGEKIELTVPINLAGEPEGVSREGGMLEQQLREMRVNCTPSNIPESIELNVEALKVGESLHISDVPAIDEVEFLDDPETLIASVVFVKAEVEPEEIEEGAEPELIGEVGDADADGEEGDE
ncbi:MAG: 50S ribosomal protein L25 [Pyrinomonadaceae bacterium]